MLQTLFFFPRAFCGSIGGAKVNNQKGKPRNGISLKANFSEELAIFFSLTSELPMNPIPEGCQEACPACRHRSWSLSDSLRQKHDFVSRQLQFLPIVPSEPQSAPEEQSFGYRRKVCLHAQWNGRAWEFGMKRRDELIPIPNCPVHDPFIREIIQVLSFSLPPSSVLPAAFLLVSGRQVTLVVKSRVLSMPDSWSEQLADRLSSLGAEGLWIHLHPSAGRKVLGKGGWQLLWGQPESLLQNGIWHGPSSFQQQRMSLYANSLERALRFFELSPGSVVLDLFSGIGISSRAWTEVGATVLGVELGSEEIHFAEKNAPAASFLRGACHLRIPQIKTFLLNLGREGNDFRLYVNPPRSGLGEVLCDWIVENPPARMAYLSCSPGSLARDLRILTRHWLEVVEIIPFDFFPLTHHVECLVLLERKTTGTKGR